MTGTGLITPGVVSFDRIKLDTWGGAYDIDNIRIGSSWESVNQFGTGTGIAQGLFESGSVFTQNGQIVANLVGVQGSSTVSVIDTKGLVVRIINNAIGLVTISLPSKGIYLVRVQNGARAFTQKVALL